MTNIVKFNIFISKNFGEKKNEGSRDDCPRFELE